jgi:acyl carrier protein
MSELTEQVALIVGRHLPPGSAPLAGPDESLADLGIGSLDLVGVIADVEAAFSVRFPEQMLVRETFSTINVIADRLTGLITERRPGGDHRG